MGPDGYDRAGRLVRRPPLLLARDAAARRLAARAQQLGVDAAVHAAGLGGCGGGFGGLAALAALVALAAAAAAAAAAQRPPRVCGAGSATALQS
jgi:hypothetical protein